MARPIEYQPQPARAETSAREELDRLLETCHRHGLLRFANDLVAANTDIARIVVEGLQSPGALNAVQNLSVLLMALSCVPPAEFYRLVFAATEGLARVARAAGPPAAPQRDAASVERRAAPAAQTGLAALYRLLRDEQLWAAILPLIEGLKGFAEGLRRPVENPISDFTGKQGRTH